MRCFWKSQAAWEVSTPVCVSLFFFFFHLYAAHRLLSCHELFFLPSLKPTFHRFTTPSKITAPTHHTEVLTDSVLIVKLFQRDVFFLFAVTWFICCLSPWSWWRLGAEARDFTPGRLMLLALRAEGKELHVDKVTRRGQTKTFRPVLKVMELWISFPTTGSHYKKNNKKTHTKQDNASPAWLWTKLMYESCIHVFSVQSRSPTSFLSPWVTKLELIVTSSKVTNLSAFGNCRKRSG